MTRRVVFFLSILIVLSDCNKEVFGPYDCASANDIRVLPHDLWQTLVGNAECSLATDPAVENFFTVRNADQYSFLLNCIDGAPAIDFTQYSLLIGSKPFADEVKLKSQSVLKACGQRKYFYRIEIEVLTSGSGSVLRYAALVPVLPQGYTAEVSFQ